MALPCDFFCDSFSGRLYVKEFLFRPAIFQLYGYVQYFCWFSSEQNDSWEIFWLKMGYFFIPLWVLFFLNLGLSIKTYLELKRIEL